MAAEGEVFSGKGRKKKKSKDGGCRAGRTSGLIDRRIHTSADSHTNTGKGHTAIPVA